MNSLAFYILFHSLKGIEVCVLKRRHSIFF
jgi:hypothetical protein